MIMKDCYQAEVMDNGWINDKNSKKKRLSMY